MHWIYSFWGPTSTFVILYIYGIYIDQVCHTASDFWSVRCEMISCLIGQQWFFHWEILGFPIKHGEFSCKKIPTEPVETIQRDPWTSTPQLRWVCQTLRQAHDCIDRRTKEAMWLGHMEKKHVQMARIRYFSLVSVKRDYTNRHMAMDQ